MLAKVLIDTKTFKVWQDTNGVLWRWDKEFNVLYKDVHGQWEQIDSLIMDELMKDVSAMRKSVDALT